jgi:hypothetical protein
LAKATGPAKFLDGLDRVSLFEEANDLLIGKSGLFHSRNSPKLADFVPSLWYGRQGAGHSMNFTLSSQQFHQHRLSLEWPETILLDRQPQSYESLIHHSHHGPQCVSTC